MSYPPPQYPQQPEQPYYTPGSSQAYGTPQYYQPPAPQKPKAAKWAWAVLALVIVPALGVGYWVYDTKIRTDSGLAACKAFRDGGSVDGKVGSGNKTISESDYRRVRKVFQDSRYDDIRAAGTKLMDVVWQVSQLGPNPGLEALPYVGQLTSAVTDIQGACANHGVIVNLNLGATPKPTTTS